MTAPIRRVLPARLEAPCDRLAFGEVVETIKAGRSVYRLPSDKTSRGLEGSCDASPRCFTGMAEIGARMTGLEWHQH